MIAYPKLKTGAHARQVIDTFRGYNHNLRIGSGEFYEMENLTSDDYPVLSTRRKRGFVRPMQRGCKGMFYVPEKGLFYLEDIGGSSVLYLLSTEGITTEITKLNPNPKRFALIGKTLIIVPDLHWVDIDSFDTGRIYQLLELNTGVLKIHMCLADGTLLEAGHRSAIPPEAPEHGTVWVDCGVYPDQIKRYAADRQEWEVINSHYVCLKGECLEGHPFRDGDGIYIDGLVGNVAIERLNGYQTVLKCLSSDTIIIDGVIGGSQSHFCTNYPVRIERKVPNLDFIVACGNRLWGCNRETNEIYASKLGDFKNWNCFAGISTDSWVGSVGTPGEFTGAVVQNDYPVFYKENFKHKVWPSATGAHQITTVPCNGVEKGMENSVAVLEGVVYYKSLFGIFADDGGIPFEIGRALGGSKYRSAFGAVFNRKYHLIVSEDLQKNRMLVYDIDRKMWHSEDFPSSGYKIDDCYISAADNSLYTASNNKLWDLSGNSGTPEEDVSWMAVTGDLGLELPEQKYISRLTLRLSLDPGATLEVYAQYDREQTWVKLGQVYGTDLRSFSLPVRPRRCDQLRLKLQGTGMCKLYSITKTLEKGSELP